MCTFCLDHGFGEKWYHNLESFLFKKIYPEPQEQEEKKKERLEDMAAVEWRERHPAYARNAGFQREFFSSHAGQVVTLEDTLKILDLAEEAVKREDTLMASARCLCALMVRGKVEYRCIFFGVPLVWAAEVGYARYPREGLTEFGGAQWSELRSQLRKGQKVPLTAAEAKDMFREWDKKGLVHSLVTRGLFPLIDGFCNCERPICMRLRQREILDYPQALVKGHFVADIDPLRCTRCRNCMEYCQFGSVYISKYSETVTIDPAKCFGCGLCRVKCQPNAISMVPRERVPVAARLM